MAFKLIDDLLDYPGDSQVMGKNLGDDLAEGKPTLPLLFAMRNGTEQQRKIIRHAIEEGGLEELPAVMRAVADTGALEHVRKIAQNEAGIGCAAIAHLPHSSHHEALRKLAEFAVNRNY